MECASRIGSRAPSLYMKHTILRATTLRSSPVLGLAVLLVYRLVPLRIQRVQQRRARRRFLRRPVILLPQRRLHWYEREAFRADSRSVFSLSHHWRS